MTDPPARRLFWIYPPLEEREQLGSAGTLLAALALVFLPAIVAFALGGALAAPIAACIGAGVATVGLPQLAKWRYERRHGTRLRRLVSLSRFPAARKRLPHRFAELALFRRSDDYATALAAMPHGSVLVIHAPDALRDGALTPLPFAFEPVALMDTSVLSRLAQPSEGATQTANESREPTPRRKQWNGGRVRSLPSGVVLAALLALLVTPLVATRLTFCSAAPIWMLVAWVAIIAFHALRERLVFDQHWWLVPGGIILARWPLWRRRRQAIWWQATHVPLAMVCEGRGAPRLALATLWLPGAKKPATALTASAGAVLRAWISATGVPGLEVVTEFLGSSADLRVADSSASCDQR